MLDAKDYKQYEPSHKKRLTLPKFFLTRWGYYEQNVMRLDHWKKENAKILYQTLGHLTEEERKFLANKYRTEEYKTDEVAAREYGLDTRQYTVLRRGIELKFFHYLNQIEGVVS